MRRFLCTVGIAVAAWALPGVGTVRAAEFRSGDIAIPFEFKVEKITLPAGRYRLEQKTGKSFVFLLNIQTGRGVQVMRESANDPTADTKLTFKRTGEGYKLSKVS
jgi:hypothetical protein